MDYNRIEWNSIEWNRVEWNRVHAPKALETFRKYVFLLYGTCITSVFFRFVQNLEKKKL